MKKDKFKLNNKKMILIYLVLMNNNHFNLLYVNNQKI